jgi:hypothetical protein
MSVSTPGGQADKYANRIVTFALLTNALRPKLHAIKVKSVPERDIS